MEKCRERKKAGLARSDAISRFAYMHSDCGPEADRRTVYPVEAARGKLIRSKTPLPFLQVPRFCLLAICSIGSGTSYYLCSLPVDDGRDGGVYLVFIGDIDHSFKTMFDEFGPSKDVKSGGFEVVCKLGRELPSGEPTICRKICRCFNRNF